MSEAAAPTSPQYDQCIQRLSYLEEALLAKDPLMKKHLAEIHKLLIGFEELTHLLSNKEVGKIMAAQQIVTNTVLIAATTGKSKATGANKKAAGIGMGDL